MGFFYEFSQEQSYTAPTFFRNYGEILNVLGELLHKLEYQNDLENVLWEKYKKITLFAQDLEVSSTIDCMNECRNKWFFLLPT